MRRAARIDDNQPAIVDAFRRLGCTVDHTHMLGRGFPDIAVGVAGRNYYVEIKDGNKPPSKQALTDAERAWHTEWRGQVCIVRSVDEVPALVAQWRAETWTPVGDVAASIAKEAGRRGVTAPEPALTETPNTGE
ncbi:hypothetical protein [Haematobacter massiliensis]|uniref:hypothetical protein n=1 Tax=Haematobacter massiliensis TaxID=195105 RepID=UPI001595059F|nr:hypothetical protein [Haematobacter massiliensis]